MKVLSEFNFAEELLDCEKTKKGSYFMINYKETRNGILDTVSSIIEEFLIPHFRSYKDLHLQDRLAFVIQELLKVTGYSQLIIPSKNKQQIDPSSLI